MRRSLMKNSNSYTQDLDAAIETYHLMSKKYFTHATPTLEGMGMSPRRITVSTSGIPKMIIKMADEHPRFKLAVSLGSLLNFTYKKRMNAQCFSNRIKA